MERDHICARVRFFTIWFARSIKDQRMEDAQDGNAQHGYTRALNAEQGKFAVALCDAIQVNRVRLCRGFIRR